MTNRDRFLWGLLGGVAVICVKVIGPDIAVVKSLFLVRNGAEIAFYGLISAITIFLGGISGLFAKETEPLRMLAFAAAFPALISTYTAPERIPSSANPAAPTEASRPANAASLALGIVSVAHAQPANGKFTCDEGSFAEQFSRAAGAYFSNKLAAGTFAVVVGSEQDFNRARALADAYARSSGGREIYVGCRKPDNPFFPIIVGGSTDMQTASTLMGEVIGEGWAPSDTYLSNYAYRAPIYEAKVN